MIRFRSLLLFLFSPQSPISPQRTLLSTQLSLSDALDGPGCSSHSSLGPAGVPIWLLLAAWFTLGLGIVCEHYFIESIEYLALRLALDEEVAGSTLLAAASSFPELFAGLFGAFFRSPSDNPGPGTTVGSSIFNISCIVSASIWASPFPIFLNLSAVLRDSLYFLLTVLVVAMVYSVTSPGEITLTEALFLVFLYVLYVILSFYHHLIFTWFSEQALRWTTAAAAPVPFVRQEHHDAMIMVDLSSPRRTPALPLEETQDIPQTIPQHLGKPSKFYANLCLPWYFVFSWTIPMPASRSDKWNTPKRLARALLSLLWVGVTTFMMIDFCTKIGTCLGMSANEQGLTILAVGTSLPDMISSYVIAKRGKGSMAVSNAIGSNIFDLLIAMGLPWAIQSAIHGVAIPVQASDVGVYILGMLAELLVYLACLYWCALKLEAWVAYPLITSFFCFIIFALITGV